MFACWRRAWLLRITASAFASVAVFAGAKRREAIDDSLAPSKSSRPCGLVSFRESASICWNLLEEDVAGSTAALYGDVGRGDADEQFPRHCED